MTNRKGYLQLFGVIAFSLSTASCWMEGGNGGSESLHITITNPADIAAFATPDVAINLVGTVDSEAEIESVEWKNDRGGRGLANGKKKWATGNIVLQIGVNTITITATTVEGDTSSKDITVEREAKPPNPGTGNADPVAMYSFSSDLSNAAPVQGATIDARPVYFFLDPGDDWARRGINYVEYRCCKGITGAGAGEAFGSAMSVSNRPWSLVIDLSGLEPGGTRRLRTTATFADGSTSSGQIFDFTVGGASVSGNSAPSISGRPPGTASVGINYSFTPDARDADGDTLSFSITNKPDWATFDRLTGRLHGIPGDLDAKTYSGIVIAVSDGRSTSKLPAFNISVAAPAAGSALLSWNPPTERVDNTPLSDLTRYEIHYGRQSGSYTNRIVVNNPGITTYLVENLASGTWYFAVTAEDSTGQASGYSNQAQTTIP